MKKLVIILLLLIVAVSAQAQIEKGTKFLGGSIRCTGSSKYQDSWFYKSVDLHIQPHFGELFLSHSASNHGLETASARTYDYEYGLNLSGSTLYFGVNFYFGKPKQKS
ncbi:MAG: hypothetical protein WCQ95_13125 [Bacteroidota bacterium]